MLFPDFFDDDESLTFTCASALLALFVVKCKSSSVISFLLLLLEITDLLEEALDVWLREEDDDFDKSFSNKAVVSALVPPLAKTITATLPAVSRSLESKLSKFGQ